MVRFVTMNAARQGRPAAPRLLRVIQLSAIVPVLIMGLGAAVAFAIALLVLGHVVVDAVIAPGRLAALIVELVRVIDAVLIGVVMTVLAFGIYELLVAEVEQPLPAALVVRNIWDLERRIIQTVVMIIAVTAMEAIVEPSPHVEQLEIVVASAIAILALALFARFGGHEPEDGARG
jgi:uncharacterized membrane protein YqhA